MSYHVRQLMHDVARFHNATGQPVLTYPLLVEQRVELRKALIKEEYEEVIEAFDAGDLVELADGLADLIYVCVGAALEMGIPLDRVWSEVQRSNMAKIDPLTGKVAYREDGKVKKPDGWTPPDIAGAMDVHDRGEI